MRRLRIHRQVGLTVLFGLSLAVTLILTVAVAQTNRIIHSQEAAADAALVAAVTSSIEERLRGAELAILSVAASPPIGEAVSARDREALGRLLSPVYQQVKSDVIRMHVHTPDSTSLLRLHDPEHYGDDLSQFRHMVNAANDRLKTIRGLERGIDGLSLRVVVPIVSDTVHVGSMEYGLEFGSEFLESLKRRQEADYSLYSYTAGARRKLASTSLVEPCPLSDVDDARVMEGLPFTLTSCTERDRILILPLTDYSGSIIGFLKMVFDRTELVAALQTLRYRISMLGILFAAAVTLVVLRALSSLLRPLTEIVEQTDEIAGHIAAGDFSFRGDVSATSHDFRDVIVAVNRIIGALRRSEQQKQAILDGFPGVLYLADRDLCVLWANRTAVHMQPDIIGQSCAQWAGEETPFACEYATLKTALETGRIEQGIHWCASDTGDDSCWEHAAVPIEGADGTVTSMIMISSDITEKMQAQRALEALNADLEDRVRREVDARKTQELLALKQSKLASIGELAAGMAHEINQPLNTISFVLENLIRRLADECSSTDYLAAKALVIEDGMERIRRIIDHVRSFSRDDASRFAELFDARRAMADAVSLVGAQCRAHGIDLTVDHADDELMILGNAGELEQILMNLLANSRHALAGCDEPSIRIWAQKLDATVHIHVEDNGRGIPESHRDRVFDPFFTTKPPGEGTGLGLSVSYGLARRMGGGIRLADAPERGAHLVVTLPLHPHAAHTVGSGETGDRRR